MKLFFYLSILLSFVLFSNNKASAQIVINEYSASNLNSFIDNFEKYEDWIELYNSTDEEIDLAGWFLSDKASKPTKWKIPAGVSIAANGYLTVWCSGRDSVSSDGIHTSFKLTQTKGSEVLVVTTPSEVVIQEIPMELTHLYHSRCREMDGGEHWKVCTAPSLGASNNGSDQFAGYAEEVGMNLISGFYTGEQIVQILDYDPELVEVRFTTDGTEPDENSAKYELGYEISIQNTLVVKSRVFSKDSTILPSKVHFNTYFIDESFSVPVFSVGADQLTDLANGEGSLRPEGSLEYFDENGDRIAISYGELNRHGQDSWILDHRSIDWISRDEMGYNKSVKAKLFNYSDRDSYQRFMFRASGDDNYPANDDWNHKYSCHIRDEYVHTLAQEGDMKLDVRAVERVVVFLNGQYWGLYGLRERPVDHDYTKEYYKQGKFEVQFLATWGNTWAEYGGDQAFEDWGVLRDFILENDMSEEENYQLVKDQLQVKSLCDYMIVNLNTVASDWLNYNTGWWRGLDPEGKHKKWGYILWDNDATFDYYINYSGVPNTDPDAAPCDIDEISEYMDEFFGDGDVGKHEKIFLKLQAESDEFRQLYYSRQADMLNTVFSCENMIETLDSMVATIAPEMGRQIDRWGGSLGEWEDNIERMRDFISERCTLIDDGMVDCFSLTGPYDVTVMVEPAGTGDIEFNTLDLDVFPWTGEYFGILPNKLKAHPIDGYEFDYWESTSLSNFTPSIDSANTDYLIEGIDTLTAVFKMITSVKESFSDLTMEVYPTLIQESFVIKLNLNTSKDISFRMVDIHGREIQDFSSFTGFYGAGEQEILVKINNSLASGVYFLQLRADNDLKTISMVKAD